MSDLRSSGRLSVAAAANGQGQNRTADTRIFSPLLYQLSYLAEGRETSLAATTSASGSVNGLLTPPAHSGTCSGTHYLTTTRRSTRVSLPTTRTVPTPECENSIAAARRAIQATAGHASVVSRIRTRIESKRRMVTRRSSDSTCGSAL